MGFKLGTGEKIVWKGETDGKTWSVWPVVDDGSPGDGLSDRTFEYRQSLGIRRVTPSTGRFDVTRDSEAKIDAWFRARGLPLTFASVVS